MIEINEKEILKGKEILEQIKWLKKELEPLKKFRLSNTCDPHWDMGNIEDMSMLYCFNILKMKEKMEGYEKDKLEIGLLKQRIILLEKNFEGQVEINRRLTKLEKSTEESVQNEVSKYAKSWSEEFLEGTNLIQKILEQHREEIDKNETQIEKLEKRFNKLEKLEKELSELRTRCKKRGDLIVDNSGEIKGLKESHELSKDYNTHKRAKIKETLQELEEQLKDKVSYTVLKSLGVIVRETRDVLQGFLERVSKNYAFSADSHKYFRNLLKKLEGEKEEAGYNTTKIELEVPVKDVKPVADSKPSCEKCVYNIHFIERCVDCRNLSLFEPIKKPSEPKDIIKLRGWEQQNQLDKESEYIKSQDFYVVKCPPNKLIPQDIDYFLRNYPSDGVRIKYDRLLESIVKKD